jgi:hypothetical protein
MSRKPKFDVSLADRQRQSREAKAKIQGKKTLSYLRTHWA